MTRSSMWPSILGRRFSGSSAPGVPSTPLPTGTRSPACSARPSKPPRAQSVYVARLPTYAGTSMPPAAAAVPRPVNPAGGRQVRPCARLDVAERDDVAGLDRVRTPRRDRLAVELRPHLRAGHGDDRVLFDLQLRPEVGDLERRQPVWVADEQVAEPVRGLVHGARRWHPGGIQPDAPLVLDRGLQARRPDLKRHPDSSPGSP